MPHIILNIVNKKVKIPTSPRIQTKKICKFVDYILTKEEAQNVSSHQKKLKQENMSNYIRFDWAMKRLLRDNIFTAREEGRFEGRMEVRLEERKENAQKLKALSVPIATIAKATGLTEQ